MYVTVCNRRLQVVLGNDLHDDEGRPTYELFRPGPMDIALDVTTPPDRRRFFLVHAIDHAYDWLLGRIDPGDDEGRKNRTAVIDQQFEADLQKQGGEKALHAVFGDNETPVPEHVPGDPIYVPVEDDAAEHAIDLWCPGCRQPMEWEAARKGQPRFCPRANGYAIPVTLACPECDKKWRWLQRCSLDGTPLPFVLTTPRQTDVKPLRPLPALSVN
jgi:hypothetical protein